MCSFWFFAVKKKKEIVCYVTKTVISLSSLSVRVAK